MAIITQNLKCKECEKCDFVAKKVAKENRNPIFEILNVVNKKMKDEKYPGFSPALVGSSKRGMIYIKSKKDNEYDHDIQVFYASKNNPISDHDAKDLKKEFMQILEDELHKYKNLKWKLEDSTRVITVKKSKNGERVACFDIALIDKSGDNHKILVNKKEEEYIWNEIGNGNEAYFYAKEKIKGEDLIELKTEYLHLKHNQKNKSKDESDYKSSSKLFIEAVNNYKNNKEN